MAKGFDRGVYRAVLRVREAYAFDAGGFLMRIYAYMATIGSISMLTLAGYSFFTAGTISSTIALATFFISPRVSKLVDEKGQHAVVPWAAAIALAGLTLMLTTVSFGGLTALCYVAALLMGFIPNAQALTRARWTYLVRTGRLGSDAPTLKTVFSYEGVIDDIAFMIGPAASIALAAALFPAAGMLGGGVCFVVGTCVLSLSRSTEPQAGWVAEASEGPRRKSIIVTSSTVRILFALMFFLGAFYGVFDTATVALAEDVGNPSAASFILIVAACVSIASGLVFGMVRLALPQYAQLVLTGTLVGCAYGAMVFIDSIEALFVVSTVAALFYAPFLITANGACEQMVPGERLTEAITWLNSGSICGLAFGPTLGGVIIDELGTTASFDFGAVLAIMIPIIAFACLPILKRRRK
ncbi:MFS transporter [Gordonibacter massiliensis (ex Traore et al. 2017)]|uniref:MFS transporter n=1 Tax=Gordonibacter massiliensis (ex Traore et al. 2017) TaxID=1841863 RepID=A0A842J9K7_9ACTN|nr:MFS transporter [Gordonibacter massiliensis (ex Traore et al. 2017)]MBC2888154.1 MFS transporter [Gordonibacter massiliensis (ex Traore et al. 2017)]